MKKAVMYGGGNIGRGFIGALLSKSGYEVTFIDVAEPVVKTLQDNRCYPLRYVSSEGHTDVKVENVTAVNGNDLEAASDVIANCDIMATAVGARILKFIVPNVVAGIRKRWANNGGPLNIIICENLNDANKIFEGMLKEQMTPEEQKKFDETVGLVEASIGRMVPVQTDEMKDGEPMRVCVERYGYLPTDKDFFLLTRQHSRAKFLQSQIWFRLSRLISLSSVSSSSTTWDMQHAHTSADISDLIISISQ